MGDESNRSDRTNVVLLHGFTQNHRCLGPLATELARRHRVVAPDLPGHGSESDRGGLDCPAAASHLARTAGRGHWFGYSLGGRLALHVALQHPEAVQSLVLLGATAGIEDDREREERRAVDRERAESLLELGVEEFARRWLELPLFDDLPPEGRFIGERSSNTAEGLAASLLNAGTGSMAPLWERLDEIGVPVLVLAGDRDQAFSLLGRRLAECIGPNARFESVPGAGHAAHLVAPAATTSAVRSFLDSHVARD